MANATVDTATATPEAQRAHDRLDAWAMQDGQLTRMEALRELAGLWNTMTRKERAVGHRTLAQILIEGYA